MADIFISYARADRTRVLPLVEILESRGWSVWWDRELIPGSAYEQVIEDAISDARVVIVVWSRESVHSEWVQAEAGDGLDRHILIPVLLDDVRVPISFRRKHAARLLGWPQEHDPRELEFLLRGIEDCLAGRLQDTTRPQVLAASGTVASGSRGWRLAALGISAAVVVVVGLAFLAGTVVRVSIGSEQPPVPGQSAQSLAVLPIVASEEASHVLRQVDLEEIRSEISRALRQLPGIRVLTDAAIETDIPLSDPGLVGRSLGVSFVLMGELHKDGDEQRLNLEIFNSLNGGRLSTVAVDLAPASLVTVPATAARMVGQALKLGGSDGSDSAPVSSEAYLAYLSGKAELRRASDTEWSRAAAFFDDAVRIEPRFGAAYAGLCQVYLEEFRITSDTAAFDAAEKNCNRALTVDAENGDVLIALGALYQVAGLYEQAILNYEHVVVAKPFDAEALRGLGQVYSSMGMVAKAEDHYRTVIRIEPTYWKNHRLLGSLYYTAGRYREAAEEYQLEAELSPNKAAPMLNLGAALYMDGDFEAAIDAWKVSAAIEGDPAAYSNLGAAQFFRGDFEEAARMYERALDLRPTLHTVWGNAAEAYYFDGNDRHHEYYQTALDLSEEHLQINPNDHDVLSAQAVYLACLGHADKASSVLSRALSIRGDDPFTWYDSARVHVRLGHDDEARESLKQALALGYSPKLAKADANFANLLSE